MAQVLTTVGLARQMSQSVTVGCSNRRNLANVLREEGKVPYKESFKGVAGVRYMCSSLGHSV